MMNANATIAIAIETTCRAGGVALGVGGRLQAAIAFEAARRHATQLVARLADLLKAAGLKPADLDEIYVSAGPGSFTGTRVGITVARTLGQLYPAIRCVSVPTPGILLEQAGEVPWQHLAVVLDAGKGFLHATCFTRQGGTAVPGPVMVATPEEFLASADLPRPLSLIGEGLSFHALTGAGLSPVFPADDPRHLPTPQALFEVGRRMAQAGEFIDYHQLLPHYARAPEAVRLFEERSR